MRVLIAGGAGEVERYLLNDLSQKGYDVTLAPFSKGGLEGFERYLLDNF